MRVIGVLDLIAGRAVHGRGGRRESYAPVASVAGAAFAAGDALALARTYVDRLGVRELYVADLDTIAGGEAAGSQDALVAALAAVGAPLWLDAGVSSTDRARHALALGAANVIVGLETLRSYDALKTICGAIGSGRVAFSLDLREGQPVFAAAASGLRSQAEPPHVIAARAATAGAGAVIVIDLARVGTGRGVDLDLIASVRQAAPQLTLLAGGGVRGVEDLARLSQAGCDGALVATALHDGRLDAGAVALWRDHRSCSE
jgi:phosphoribosylformimino-5-aminoimidazole carboxamide ribotide isomerase